MTMLNNLRPEHFTGSLSELKAACYFLRLGRQVFFPVVQQGPVDFVVEDGPNLKRVQVKTATWSKTGKNRYLQARTRLTNKYQDFLPRELYDILFVVSDLGNWMIPSEVIESSNISLANTGKNECQWEEYKLDEHLETH